MVEENEDFLANDKEHEPAEWWDKRRGLDALIGQFVDDFEEQLGYLKYSLLPSLHKGEIDELVGYAHTKLMTELAGSVDKPGFYHTNKFRSYARFTIGYCTYLYITAGGGGMSREFVVEKVRAATKAVSASIQLNWKLETRLLDALASYTLDLCHISKTAFFQTNVS